MTDNEISNYVMPSPMRTEAIMTRIARGEKPSAVGEAFGISKGRVYQIIRARSKKMAQAAAKPKAQIVKVERVEMKFNWFTVRTRDGKKSTIFSERVGRELGSYTRGYFLASPFASGWQFANRVFDQTW